MSIFSETLPSFELDGERLEPFDISTSRGLEISNVPDSHYGTLESPVVLTPTANANVYKVFEDGHIYIIRDGEKYTLTGTEVE